jgi:hypothetical protein
MSTNHFDLFAKMVTYTLPNNLDKNRHYYAFSQNIINQSFDLSD